MLKCHRHQPASSAFEQSGTCPKCICITESPQISQQASFKKPTSHNKQEQRFLVQLPLIKYKNGAANYPNCLHDKETAAGT
jgi:hypothetical protein